MITHEEALEAIRRHVTPLDREDVSTWRCAGRVLAADVTSRLASPPFNKSAMDGFAVRACDVAALPAELTVVGESFAGGWPGFRVGRGECARIATGAPVPEGADTVVMMEHTRELPDGKVRIEKLSGRNICDEGEDIRVGQAVLRAGQRLTPLHVGVAASAGYDRLAVFRKPSIALVCTGTEVVRAPAPVRRGQIYDSNGPMMSALLAPHADSFQYMGVVGDRGGELDAAVSRGLESDLLVITGGISVGQFDLVPEALREAGVEIHFRQCAIKPGKPVVFGTRGRTRVVGLPGNPQSCFVVYHVLLRALLAWMSGAGGLPQACKTGRMSQAFRNKGDRKTFRPCRIEVRDGVSYIVPVACSGSANIMGASAAGAYLVIPRGVELVEKDQLMEFFEV